MDGDVMKLTHQFSKRILWELDQYRKCSNVHWEDFYDGMILLAEGKIPKLATLTAN